jgi:hypothetical protein
MQATKTSSDRPLPDADRVDEALTWLLRRLCWEASLTELRARRERRTASGSSP